MSYSSTTNTTTVTLCKAAATAYFACIIAVTAEWPRYKGITDAVIMSRSCIFVSLCYATFLL